MLIHVSKRFFFLPPVSHSIPFHSKNNNNTNLSVTCWCCCYTILQPQSLNLFRIRKIVTTFFRHFVHFSLSLSHSHRRVRKMASKQASQQTNKHFITKSTHKLTTTVESPNKPKKIYFMSGSTLQTDPIDHTPSRAIKKKKLYKFVSIQHTHAV